MACLRRGTLDTAVPGRGRRCWGSGQNRHEGIVLSDEVVDLMEKVANGETPKPREDGRR